MVKHEIFVFAILGIFIFAVMPLVSAQEVIETIISGVKTAYDKFIAPTASFLLKEDDVSGELFFSKLLLFILMISIVYLALHNINMMSSHPRTLMTVSFIVSVLSIRYITAAWVETILLPYTTLAVALATILPWIIFAVFVEQAITSSVMRRVAWFFAGAVYIGIYIYRTSDPVFTASGSTFKWIYLFVILGCLSMFFFDHTIQNGIDRIKHANKEDKRRRRLLYNLTLEYEHVRFNYDQAISRGGVVNILRPGANLLIDGIRARAQAGGIDQNLFRRIP